MNSFKIELNYLFTTNLMLYTIMSSNILEIKDLHVSLAESGEKIIKGISREEFIKFGFKIIEVPIVFTNRIKGVSKMSGGIFNEAIWGVIKLKWRSLFKSYKRAK